MNMVAPEKARSADAKDNEHIIIFEMRTESRKKIQVLCFIAMIIVLLLFLKASYNQWPLTVLGKDFTAYWASARLLIDGQNPYQADQIFALQSSVGSTDKKPTVMYNPPWVLTFIIPFALENYPLVKLFWILLIFICTLISSNWLWQFYGGADKDRLWLLLFIFAFMPFYYVYARGQIVPLILLGIIGFLHFERQKKWFLAGACACLLGIKPHATYLFLMAILFWIAYQKQWRVLYGLLVVSFIAAAIPLLYNPNVYSQYYTDVLTRSFQCVWRTPTLGTFLIDIFGRGNNFLQNLPFLAGIAWFLYQWRRNYTRWDWAEQVPLLIFVSLMTTFYAWVNDYILLLVAIIQASIWLINNPVRSKLMIFLYIVINLASWVTIFTCRSEEWVIWIVPALMINYLLVKKIQIDYEAQNDQYQKCNKLSSTNHP